MTKRLAFLGLLAACDAASPDTLLGELRVVSLRADPPVYDPNVGLTLTATTYAPRSARVLTWTCTPGPLGCLEAGFEGAERPLATFASVATPTDEETTHEVVASPVPVDPATLPPTFAWALACEDGVCPLLDAVTAAPEPGSDAWREAVDALADPFTLLKGLPKVGTAATTRTLTPATLPAVPPTNPTLAPSGPTDALVVPSGGRLALTFAVDRPGAAFPLATAGGFADTSSPAVEGVVTVELVAGDPEMEEAPPLAEGTVVRLYVPFEADDGGAAIWRGTATVGPPP